MRRVLMAALSAIILATLTLATVSLSLPSERPANGPVYTAPSATPALPMCATEDGSGQALCWWDAQAQGNGQGTSMVSGDCAPSVLGDYASSLCVNLYARDSKTITNSDGSSITIPNGVDLARECLDEFEGIELENCLSIRSE